jgi:hypothetical protein
MPVLEGFDRPPTPTLVKEASGECVGIGFESLESPKMDESAGPQGRSLLDILSLSSAAGLPVELQVGWVYFFLPLVSTFLKRLATNAIVYIFIF